MNLLSSSPCVFFRFFFAAAVGVTYMLTVERWGGSVFSTADVHTRDSNYAYKTLLSILIQMAARRRVATQPNQNRITDGKGLGSNMEYEIAKASGQHRNSSSGASKFADFLGVIQSNDEMLQLKRNDLDELKKKNKNLKNALKTVPVTNSKGSAGTDFPETKEDSKSGSAKKKSRKAAMSPSSTPADIIARLQDQGDMFARKIEVEKRKIDDLQGKIDTLLAKSADQRKKMGGINAARENQIAVNKRLKVLENRLDQAMIKYNESLSKNKSLREEINESRRQRLVYDSVYKEKNWHQEASYGKNHCRLNRA